MRLAFWLLVTLLLGGCATREVGVMRPAVSQTAAVREASKGATCDSGKVVFVTIDGTSNTPVSRTAAARLHEMVEAYSYMSHGHPLAVWYAEGVGSADRDIVGKALGVGVNDDIKKAYAFLTSVWQPGDCLFLNGFSRGAFSVRALGGLLYMAGIPDLSAEKPSESARIVDDLFDAYKTRIGYSKVNGLSVTWTEGVAQARSDRIRRVYSRHKLDWPAGDASDPRAPGYSNAKTMVVIEAMTIWDTVQALGLPDGSEDPGEQPAHFLMTACNAKAIFQPLSLDDNRVYSFTPILAGGKGATELCSGGGSRQSVNRTVEDVWFSGAHADVGGTYSAGAMLDGELSSVSLNWLLGRLGSDACDRCGAMLSLPEKMRVPEERLTAVHDGKRTSGAYKGLYRQSRKPTAYWSQIYGPTPISIHASVLDRLEWLFALDEVTPGCLGSGEPAPGKPVICARELARYGLLPELWKAGCLEISDWGYRLKSENGGKPCVSVVGDRIVGNRFPDKPCPVLPPASPMVGRVYKGEPPVTRRTVVELEDIKIPFPRCVGGRVS